MMKTSDSALRIGSVVFLNAKPLVRFLNLDGARPIQFMLEVPSRLADLMKSEELDIALLPSVEYFRAPNYRILPEICIASDGPVESVKVFSKVPLERINSLALDTSSRTSAALVQVLMKRRFGKLPELSECSPSADIFSMKEDAMLLIGDPAMKFQSHPDMHTLDLGEEWKRQTGLPFVYALWVAREGVDLKDAVERLLQARSEGMANLPQIAAEAAIELGIDEAVCLNYLTTVIQYQLGERQVQGLSLFQKLAAEIGLCPGGAEIATYSR
jgi:chorismate dehydratase